MGGFDGHARDALVGIQWTQSTQPPPGLAATHHCPAPRMANIPIIPRRAVLIRFLTDEPSAPLSNRVLFVLSSTNSAAMPSACPSSSNTARQAKQSSALAIRATYASDRWHVFTPAPHRRFRARAPRVPGRPPSADHSGTAPGTLGRIYRTSLHGKPELVGPARVALRSGAPVRQLETPLRLLTVLLT